MTVYVCVCVSFNLGVLCLYVCVSAIDSMALTRMPSKRDMALRGLRDLSVLRDLIAP